MMGTADLMRIFPIVQEARRLEKKYNWGYEFHWDQGTFETAIVFKENGTWERPTFIQSWAEVRAKNLDLFCPDIIDFQKKIIIEFEEESLPMKGPKIRKKGHWEESKRDSRRDKFYKKGKFSVLKIWESEYQSADNEWGRKLDSFLVGCFTRRIKPGEMIS